MDEAHKRGSKEVEVEEEEEEEEAGPCLSFIQLKRIQFKQFSFFSLPLSADLSSSSLAHPEGSTSGRLVVVAQRVYG